MGLTPEKEMQHACEQWLEARERLHDGEGTGGLHGYREAGRRLFAAFASEWTGDDARLLSAYRSFQEALVEGRKRRFSTPARPEKTPRSKFWS